MIRLYLITGFLGAGKTTFLKNLIQMLSGKKLRIIVNEFGREGIDGVLLRETGAAVEEINNGSIFCSCRLGRFEEALKSVAAEHPDIILVEASGLSDPTHIEKVLSQSVTADGIEYMGGICLVDAVNFKKVLATARVCRKQVSVCDLVLVNKTDLVTQKELSQAEALVREVKPDAVIRRTLHAEIALSWLDDMHKAAQPHDGPAFHLKDVSLQSLRITLSGNMKFAQLEKFLSMFIEDTYRIKGFVFLEGRTALVDCVGTRLQINPYDASAEHPNVLTAIAGGGMQMEQSVRQAVKWYPLLVESVQWDN